MEKCVTGKYDFDLGPPFNFFLAPYYYMNYTM